MARPGPLSPKHQRFVDEYLVDHNGAQAAARAGYSPRSAKVTASRLLTDANIQAAIQAKQKEAASHAGVTLQRIVEEFAKLAFTNLNQMMTWDGTRLTLKPSAQLTPEEAAAVLEVAESESKSGKHLMRVKLYSKQQALESLLKCLQAINLEERVSALEEAIRQRRSGTF
jgi:phage terminase small subunit